MTPEDERAKQIARAGEAQQLLDSRLFQEAKDDIDSTLADLRRTVPISATDMHTRIILMDQLWGKLQDYFVRIAQSGKMASLEIAEQEQRRKSIMDRVLSFRTTGRNSL